MVAKPEPRLPLPRLPLPVPKEPRCGHTLPTLADWEDIKYPLGDGGNRSWGVPECYKREYGINSPKIGKVVWSDGTTNDVFFNNPLALLSKSREEKRELRRVAAELSKYPWNSSYFYTLDLQFTGTETKEERQRKIHAWATRPEVLVWRHKIFCERILVQARIQDQASLEILKGIFLAGLLLTSIGYIAFLWYTYGGPKFNFKW
jgi:hypothetical protein